jgi:hypothetical protein
LTNSALFLFLNRLICLIDKLCFILVFETNIMAIYVNILGFEFDES